MVLRRRTRIPSDVISRHPEKKLPVARRILANKSGA